jgi:hypothetical protein
MTSNTISIGLECVQGKHGIHESNHLLIKRLIVPHTLALVIHFIPPTQSNQYPPTYILHCPKVNAMSSTVTTNWMTKLWMRIEHRM